jgi:hypothetical protein
MNNVLLFGIFVSAAGLVGPAMAGSFTYVQLPPGTFASAVNSNDVVVGSTLDNEGFVWQNGKLTKVSAGKPYYTQLTAINAAGLAIGQYGIESSQEGVTYDTTTGKVSVFKIRKHGWTFPMAINASGAIAGYDYWHQNKYEEGFVRLGKSVTKLHVPGAKATLPVDINDAGAVVGTYSNSGGPTEGFIYSNNAFTLYTAPGATDTYASAISANGEIGGRAIVNGTITGFTFDGANTTFYDFPGSDGTIVVGFGPGDELVGTFNNNSQSFVYTGGQYYQIAPPGSMSTVVLGVNAQGWVVGVSYPSDGTAQGFIGECSQAPCTQ